MIDRLEFENNFTSDEEVEAMLDSLLENTATQIEEEDNKSCIIRPDKVKAVLFTYKLLKYLTKNSNAKVTYVLNEPYRSTGCVSVCGKELSFNNPEWFMAAIRLSSNFNTYVKTNGTVQMDFTFHGLTKTLE